MKEFFLPLLFGFVSGILSSWGVGGGTLLLLLMTLFLGVDQRAAQGITLLFFLPTAAASLVLHRKNGFLDRAALRRAIPFAVLFSLLAAFAATSLSTELFRKPFGLFLLAAAISMLKKNKDG